MRVAGWGQWDCDKLNEEYDNIYHFERYAVIVGPQRSAISRVTEDGGDMVDHIDFIVVVAVCLSRFDKAVAWLEGL